MRRTRTSASGRFLPVGTAGDFSTWATCYAGQTAEFGQERTYVGYLTGHWKKLDYDFGKMRKHTVLTTLASMSLLGLLGSAPVLAAEKTPKIPPALQGKAYKAVRAKILAAGWRPDYRPASMEWEKALQKRYPELRYCAVDGPLCSLYFTGKNASCLRVVTRGEAPEEYRVETVTHECDDVAQ